VNKIHQQSLQNRAVFLAKLNNLRQNGQKIELSREVHLWLQDLNLDHLIPKVDNPSSDQRCEWEKKILDIKDDLFHKSEDMVLNFMRKQKT
jgi:hypothetical protein